MLDRFETFVSVMNALYKDYQKVKSFKMKDFGLKSCHVMCMFYLGQNVEGLTANELCEKCREDKAAISRNLKYLTERGYIETRGEENQKYRLRNILTKEGREVYEKIEVLISSIVERLGKGLSKKERDAVYSGLAKILNNFEIFIEEKEKSMEL